MGFKIMSKFSINSDIIGQTMDSCIDVGDTYIILNFSKKDNQLQCMSNISTKDNDRDWARERMKTLIQKALKTMLLKNPSLSETREYKKQ